MTGPKALRAALTATEPRRLAGLFAGWALVLLALVLVLTSSAIVAVILAVAGVALLWLAGAWVLPRTTDAYHRRVERILGGWTGEVDDLTAESPEEIAFHGRRALDRLEETQVPGPRRQSHEQLTEALASYLGALSGGDDEAVRARHAELDAQLEELEGLRLAAWRAAG